MNIELRLLDTVKLCNTLSRNFACSCSEDNRICVLTDSRVYVLSLKSALTSPFPNFACTKSFLRLSNSIPSDDLDLDINSFHKELDRKDLYETVLTNELSANLNHMKALKVYPLCSEWSSRGIVNKTDCLLGVLSSLHNLELFITALDKNEFLQFHSVIDVTKSVIEEEKKRWVNSTRLPIAAKFEEFKKRVITTLPSAFTWSHTFRITVKNACVIFVGHLNGSISVWRIDEMNTYVAEARTPQFLGRHSTQLKQISTMCWHQTNDYGGALCFGDIEGKVSILFVAGLHQSEVELYQEMGLFTKSDNISVDKIEVMEYSDSTFILVFKQAVLIVYGIDQCGQIFDQKVQYIEEYYVTGIHCFNDCILVLSLPGIFTQFQLSKKDNEIHLEEKKISFKTDKTLYRTHGLVVSKNRAFFGILTYPWQMQQFGKSKTDIDLYIYHNSCENPLDILWNNPTGSLRDYWDCLEILRLVCIKEKRFPWLGLPANLNYDGLSLVQLKTLRCIAQISETVYELIPVIKNYNIKSFILIHYLLEMKLIVKRLKKLFDKDEDDLTIFQINSIEMQYFFLKEMVVNKTLAKCNIGPKFMEEIGDVMEIASLIDYPDVRQCIWCGNKLLGSICFPPHADMRCSFSMMQINVYPGYKCLYCNALAHIHIEIEEEILCCPYCDVRMEKIPNNVTIYNILAEEINIDWQGVIRSDCFRDCLKEEISLEDIENNEIEYIVLSDNDSDFEDEDDLHMLYATMSNCSLEELQRSVNFKPAEPSLKRSKTAKDVS